LRQMTAVRVRMRCRVTGTARRVCQVPVKLPHGVGVALRLEDAADRPDAHRDGQHDDADVQRAARQFCGLLRLVYVDSDR
jgi:hypothetical protein